MDGHVENNMLHTFTPLQVGAQALLAGLNINVKALPALKPSCQNQSQPPPKNTSKTLTHSLPQETQIPPNQDGASIGEPAPPASVATYKSCCVPNCTSSSRLQPHLAFHDFPEDDEKSKKWVNVIQGGKNQALGVCGGRRYVCEEHFQPEDYKKSPYGATKLRLDATPSCFQYPPPALYSVASEHNYCKESKSVKLAQLQVEREQLRAECKKLEEAALKERYGLLRFVDSDDAIQFYTRFPTYKHFMAFWRVIEPAALHMKYVSNGKRHRKVLAAPSGLKPLSLIDEFFLFMVRLVQGLELLDLAQLFKVECSCAEEITSFWVTFLYNFLASVPTWIPRESVRAHLPAEFQQRFPDTCVVLDFVEFRCRTPFSHWERKDDEDELLLFAGEHECDATLKAMVGMAPHGLVTFVSRVFPASLSDKEVFRRSGIIPLLTPKMAVIVDESLDVDNVAPCQVHQLPFLSKEKEVAVYNMRRSTKLLRLRIDQMFQRVRSYELFKAIVPLSAAGSLNQMFTVACKLVNYQS